MAKRKRRSLINKHVRLNHWMMNSDAWRHLQVGPRQLLVEMYRLFDGTNNGRLFLSVRDAAKRLNVSPNTVMPWFHALIEKGFIVASQRGAFSLKKRHATSWILTEFSVGDALPTRDFMRWKAPIDNQKPVSETDTNGIKNCVRGTDLPTPKHPSRSQFLTPSKPNLNADGIRNCDTSSLPGGDGSSDTDPGTNTSRNPSPNHAGQSAPTPYSVAGLLGRSGRRRMTRVVASMQGRQT